jgi:hypothetical protein
MLVRLIYNAVFWLNAFPHADGVSDTLSPRYLLTGQHLDYRKHVRLEFGAYVQTHEDHTNNMAARTVGAICLGPSGNEQGGHYFLSLMSGHRILRDRWTELPMPHDAIVRVGQLGRAQGMPKTLTFADRHGHEIPDDAGAVDDDHDSDYDPADDEASTDSSSASDNDDDDDDDHGDDDDDDHGDAQPLPGLTAGVDSDDDDDSDGNTDADADSANDGGDGDDNDDNASDDDGSAGDDESDSDPDDEPGDEPTDEPPEPELNIPDETVSTPTPTPTAEPRRITGVGGEHSESPGVRGDRDRTFHDTRAEHRRMHEALMDDRYGPRPHDRNLRPRRP